MIERPDFLEEYVQLGKGKANDRVNEMMGYIHSQLSQGFDVPLTVIPNNSDFQPSFYQWWGSELTLIADGYRGEFGFILVKDIPKDLQIQYRFRADACRFYNIKQ